MKLFIILCTVLASSAAFSAEFILSTKTVFWKTEYIQGIFEVNEDLGRAWTVLTFDDKSDPDSVSVEERIQVPGMSFDKTTKEVIIITETGRVVCAYQKRGIFGIKRLKETGDCVFKKTIFTVNHDNGFEIRKIQKQRITLIY